MTASGDHVYAVVSLDSKDELLSFHSNQFNRCCSLKPRWRGGLVADVDVRSDGLFVRPVEVRIDCLDARPLKKADKKACGKYFRHCDQPIQVLLVGRLKELTRLPVKGVVFANSNPRQCRSSGARLQRHYQLRVRKIDVLKKTIRNGQRLSAADARGWAHYPDLHSAD